MRTAELTVGLLPGETLRPSAELKIVPAHLLRVYEMGSRGVGPQFTLDLCRTASTAAPAPPASITLAAATDLQLLAAKWGCADLPAVVNAMFRGIEAALHT